MNCRNFHIPTDSVGGSCLIPAVIARRMRDVCHGNSQTLMLIDLEADGLAVHNLK